VAGFLARYSDSTRKSYAYDLRAFFGWCERAGLRSWRSAAAHRALRRMLEENGLARATISRRLSTLTGFYRSLSSTEPSRPPRLSIAATPG